MQWVQFKGELNFVKLCLLGNLKAIQILLNKDPDLIDKNFSPTEAISAFDYAIHSGQVDFIRFIWEKGGCPKGQNPFYNAMIGGNRDVLKMLLTELPELDVKGYFENEAKTFPSDPIWRCRDHSIDFREGN